MKPGETVLERAIRKLSLLNQRINVDTDREDDVEYIIQLHANGSGLVRETCGPVTVEFTSLHQLMAFLDAPFAEQVRAIRKGRV